MSFLLPGVWKKVWNQMINLQELIIFIGMKIEQSDSMVYIKLIFSSSQSFFALNLPVLVCCNVIIFCKVITTG